MNNINEIEIFKNNKDTLKNISGDKSEYMTESLLEAINFDKVKKEYCCSLKLSNLPTSCDALYQAEEIFFIEFKNGSMSSGKIYEIHKKIYDSILIFMELTGFKINEVREKVNFILVYNESKTKEYLEEDKKRIQTPESYNKILKKMGGLAKINIPKFNLSQYQKYIVKDVYTYTEKEFEDNFIKKYTSIEYLLDT